MLSVSRLEGIREGMTLFSNLTFSLNPGEWAWIRGKNGSGKTTLLKVLVGLLPSRGKIFWNNTPVSRFEAGFLQDLLYLGHKPALHPGLTVQENLSWFAALHNSRNRNASYRNTVLELLGLSKFLSVPCEQMSFGQKHRVALARLFLQPAKFWVLDEPCTGLDAKAQRIFSECLVTHLNQGGIAVMASHHELEIEAVPKPSSVIEMEAFKP